MGSSPGMKLGSRHGTELGSIMGPHVGEEETIYAGRQASLGGRIGIGMGAIFGTFLCGVFGLYIDQTSTCLECFFLTVLGSNLGSFSEREKKRPCSQEWTQPQKGTTFPLPKRNPNGSDEVTGFGMHDETHKQQFPRAAKIRPFDGAEMLSK